MTVVLIIIWSLLAGIVCGAIAQLSDRHTTKAQQDAAIGGAFVAGTLITSIVLTIVFYGIGAIL